MPIEGDSILHAQGGFEPQRTNNWLIQINGGDQIGLASADRNTIGIIGRAWAWVVRIRATASTTTSSTTSSAASITTASVATVIAFDWIL